VNNNRASDYKKEIHHRLLASGIDDEMFIKRFFERWGDDIQSDLTSDEAFGPARYEETLESWTDMAEKDFQHYELDRPVEVQEGKIRPKKRKSRRVRKPRDIAGVWERQDTLARYLKEVASEDRKIIRFRERALSGQLLSEEGALAFLSSPLMTDQSFLELWRNGISLLEKSHLLEEETDEYGRYRWLVVEGRCTRKVRPLAAKGSELVYPGDALRAQDARGLRGGGAIFFPHPREEDRLVIAREGSVVAELLRLAEKVLVGYPISPEMSVWFILTGEFIHQDPVRMRYVTYSRPEFSRTTITLEVESWLPPEEVLEQYRYVQRETLGGTPRSLKRKTVTLFEFVHRHKGKSWGELFDAWNKAHPAKGQRFRDRSHLFTTYKRALEYIAGAKPTKYEDGKRPKIAGTDSHDFPIFADKWYLLHPQEEAEEHPREEGEEHPREEGDSYTGTFETREEAQGDPRSKNSEPLRSKELVSRLAEREKKRAEKRASN
jgi:hypothetical protein